MSKELYELMKRADALTPEEQLSLMSYLVERLRRCEIKSKPHHNVKEFRGIAPNYLGGIDAQEYVSRIRRGEFPEFEIEPREHE